MPGGIDTVLGIENDADTAAEQRMEINLSTLGLQASEDACCMRSRGIRTFFLLV